MPITNRNEYSLQLTDLATQRALFHGGKFLVTAATNPGTIVGGGIAFRVDSSIGNVDIYIYTDKGYAAQLYNVDPQAFSKVLIDIGRLIQFLVLPFDILDAPAATETDTGFKLVNNVYVNPFMGIGIEVTAADSTKTIDVGTDGTGGSSNVANGLISGALLTTLGFVPAASGFTIGTNSVYYTITGDTFGSLLHATGSKITNSNGTDSTTTKNGVSILVPYKCSVDDKVTYTLSSGSTTGKGRFMIPTILPKAAY